MLYGDVHMTPNMHLLSHLAGVVKNWGPLWAYSLFQFESANGRLQALVAGTNGVVTQISQKYATMALFVIILSGITSPIVFYNSVTMCLAISI